MSSGLYYYFSTYGIDLSMPTKKYEPFSKELIDKSKTLSENEEDNFYIEAYKRCVPYLSAFRIKNWDLFMEKFKLSKKLIENWHPFHQFLWIKCDLDTNRFVLSFDGKSFRNHLNSDGGEKMLTLLSPGYALRKIFNPDKEKDITKAFKKANKLIEPLKKELASTSLVPFQKRLFELMVYFEEERIIDEKIDLAKIEISKKGLVIEKNSFSIGSFYYPMNQSIEQKERMLQNILDLDIFWHLNLEIYDSKKFTEGLKLGHHFTKIHPELLRMIQIKFDREKERFYASSPHINSFNRLFFEKKNYDLRAEMIPKIKLLRAFSNAKNLAEKESQLAYKTLEKIIDQLNAEFSQLDLTPFKKELLSATKTIDFVKN